MQTKKVTWEQHVGSWKVVRNIIALYFVDMSQSLACSRALPYSVLSGLETFSIQYMQEILVIRKMQPCLPSFKAEFTASVPLTRIRDIAHRNDIPHDLKVVFWAATTYLFSIFPCILNISMFITQYYLSFLLLKINLPSARDQTYYTKQTP